MRAVPERGPGVRGATKGAARASPAGAAAGPVGAHRDRPRPRGGPAPRRPPSGRAGLRWPASGSCWRWPLAHPASGRSTSTRPGNATPFPVTPQPVAYLTTEGNQITIYQTQVSSVCPPSAPDCTDPGPSARPVARVALDAALSPRDLALAADGNLAITARDSLGRAIYSVVALPGSEATATASPSVSPRATASRRPGSPTPSAVAPVGRGERAAGPTRPAFGGRPGRCHAPAAPQRRHRRRGARGLVAGWHHPGLQCPSGRRQRRARRLRLARRRGGREGPHEGPPLVLRLVGRPADRHQPDAGDARGGEERLVASVRRPRLGHRARRPARPRRRPSVAAATMLLDPATGAAQRVALADAWLPAVDPTGRLVVFWSGTLTAHGPTVDLTAGIPVHRRLVGRHGHRARGHAAAQPGAGGRLTGRDARRHRRRALQRPRRPAPATPARRPR